MNTKKAPHRIFQSSKIKFLNFFTIFLLYIQVPEATLLLSFFLTDLAALHVLYISPVTLQ